MDSCSSGWASLCQESCICSVSSDGGGVAQGVPPHHQDAGWPCPSLSGPGFPRVMYKGSQQTGEPCGVEAQQTGGRGLGSVFPLSLRAARVLDQMFLSQCFSVFMGKGRE